MSKKKQVAKVKVEKVNVEEVEQQVVTPVIEIEKVTVQPYNQAVDVLQKAFVFFNQKLCNNELNQVPVITIQSKGRRSAYGWFWDCSWKNGADEQLRPEINIAAEYLSRSAVNIMETLIHELAHMINAKRNVKDCNAAQYHNKKFKATAEELGLTCEKMGAYGYAKTGLGERAKAAVDQFILETNCSVFDSFNRVERSRKWRKVWTIPCDEDAKNEVKRIALEQNITEKQVVNILLSTYTNQAVDAMELQ